MKKFRNISIIILLPLFLGLIFILTSSDEDSRTGENVRKLLQIFAPHIPDQISFCGEEVPLDKFYVKEQLDRELTVNTYFHSSTIMLVKRAHRWFPVIEPILKEENVPDDFKYMALIESGLMNVVSPSGAAGFWQFLEPTAKEYGLRINKEIDERYHLVKATHATCRYLKDAYLKYGNWTLAAASYNAGMNRINIATEKQKTNNYYDLSLNDETSRYIFRILALKDIFRDPGKFGFSLEKEDLYEPIPTYKVEIDSTIEDLPGFAIEHGTTYRFLKELNPWLMDTKLTVTNTSYIILLPAV